MKHRLDKKTKKRRKEEREQGEKEGRDSKEKNGRVKKYLMKQISKGDNVKKGREEQNGGKGIGSERREGQ